MKRILSVLSIALLLVACGNDDNGAVQVPPRLLSEVEPENRAEIIAFLKTHFYNYEDFLAPPSDFDFKVRIDTIAGDNADKTALIQQVDSAIVNVSSNQFRLTDGEEDIPHQYYYLSAKEGAGESPTIADSTLLKYEGMFLSGDKFDASESFVWQRLPFFLRGYANGVSKIKSGTQGGVVVNNDGTTDITDSGIGLIIMPAGLGYFLADNDIPAYSPLIFSVEIGTFVENTDDDNDGVPSILEDLNGNGYLFDDNTDEEDERASDFPLTVDFIDADDDDDGVSTREEISDADGNIIFPYPSTGGIPDYLNPDVQRRVEDN